MQSKKSQGLARSSSHRMVAGVCAGIANYFGWPISRVRIGYAALSILSAGFPGILVYLLLWVIMPQEPREPRRFRVGHSR